MHIPVPTTHEKRNNVSQQDLLSCQETQGPDLYHLPLGADPYSNTGITRLKKDTGKLDTCQSRAQKLAGVPKARSQDYG